MQLPEGVTVVIGSHTYKKEIPDHLVEKDLKKTIDKKVVLRKKQKEEREKEEREKEGKDAIVTEDIDDLSKKKK